MDRVRAGGADRHYLATVAGPVIIVVGVLSIAAGVLYTGGPRPYGYAGMGELFVFLFFGLVAVNGSYYVQLEELDCLPLLLSVSVGFLSTAILVVNNVRDLQTTSAPASGRWRCALGASEHGRCCRADRWRLRAAADRDRARRRALAGAYRRGLGASGAEPAEGSSDSHRGPVLNGALAGTGALLGASSLLLSVGLVLGYKRDEGLSMKIERAETFAYSLPFAEPYVTARGEIREREMVLCG